MRRTNELSLPDRKCLFGCTELPLSSGSRRRCRRHLRKPWRSRIEASQHGRPVLDPKLDERITHAVRVSDLSAGIEQFLIPAWRIQEHASTLNQHVLCKRQGSGIRDAPCGRDGHAGIDDRTLQDVGVHDHKAGGPRDRSSESGLARAGHPRELYEHSLNLARSLACTDVPDRLRNDARSGHFRRCCVRVRPVHGSECVCVPKSVGMEGALL